MELTMEKTTDRRKENRLRYHWPVWFAEDFNSILSQGQMIDVSSTSAAFTCHTIESCPCPGQEVTARFSVPCFGPNDAFDLANFTRKAHVRRIDDVNSMIKRIAVQFAEPLHFKPGEQLNCPKESQEFSTLPV